MPPPGLAAPPGATRTRKMPAAAEPTALESVVTAEEATRSALEMLLPPDVKGRAPRLASVPQVGGADPARLAEALGEALGRAMLQPAAYSSAVGKHAVGV